VADPEKAKGRPDTEAIRDRNRRLREEAAAKRRKRSEVQTARVRRNLDTSELMDDAFARSTHAVATWLKSHFNIVQWVVLGGLALWIGSEIYAWRVRRQREQASEELAAALRIDNGRVGSETPEPGPDGEVHEDTRPAFPTDERRLAAASGAFRKAVTTARRPNIAALAELGLAGTLYDEAKYGDAKGAYERVQKSDLYGSDHDVKGRTLEGLGLSLEGLGQLDAALKVFRELTNTDVVGFGALGLYDQARILHEKGDDTQAKELLKKAEEKLKAFGDKDGRLADLAHSLRELLEVIDPAAAAASAAAEITPELLSNLSQGPNGKGITPEQLERLKQELAKRMRSAPVVPPGAAAPASTPAPGPAPPASTPAPGGSAP
jgi:tetratricopeptide (TPR) repeat protein